MRIVIDLQAVQTHQSRNRGIGRYAAALARAMLQAGSNHEFIVALNGMYAGTVMAVRESLEGLIPQHRIVTWHASLPARAPAGEDERLAYEKVRHAFLESLRPDFVHVASLFEFDDLSLSGIAAQRSFNIAVTLYDLIPLIYSDTYLPTPGGRYNYDVKLENLRRADLWLSISESSRREGISLLGLPEDRVVNISCAADSHFTPGTVPGPAEVELRARHGLLRPFVMYTGGIDPRKNIEGLIEAWAALPPASRDEHQLAIVCSVQADERTRLEELARTAGFAPGELVLTGFVPEDDLVHLYRLCKLFVFPSRHEGFGLPALEAMSCGAPVIAAGNSSLPEVIGRDDALFDALSRESIAGKLQQALTDDAFRADLARFGPRQAREFTWEHSARVALAAMERIGPPARRTAAPKPATRPRLAYVSPLPPAHSGIADYSAELVPALARHYDIEVVVDQGDVEPAIRGHVRDVLDAKAFDERAAGYDRILYHFGNSEFHEFMVPLLRKHPGTVVMHDFFLSGMQAHRELVSEKQPHWSRALYDSHGWHALTARAAGGDLTHAIHAFPANFEVLRNALGVIVHSPFSMHLAREWYGPGADEGWRVIPHLRVALPRHRDEARAALRLGPADFLVCAFGLVGPTKMNDRLVRAWRQSRLAGDAHCRLVFVGENDPGEFGRSLLKAVQGSGNVQITGWASPETFRRYLNAADVAVQLRTMSRGETSGTVLDAMNHGVPVIANANGTMAYLPRDAAIVLEEDFTDAQLAAAIESLHADRAMREAMGRAGRSHIERAHSPGDCALAYADAIESFHAKARSPALLMRDLASGLPDWTPDHALQAIAAAVSHNDPGPVPARQLFVDIASWQPGNTQVLPMLQGLLDAPLPGWRAEPVVRGGDGRWRYARQWMLRAAPGGPHLLDDDLVEMRRGDVWALFPWTSVPPEAKHEGIESTVLWPEGDAEMAWAWVAALADPRGAPRCFVDISELVRHDWQSGIQRVTKNHLVELLRRPPAGGIVVPVYTQPGQRGYRAAWAYLRKLAGMGGESPVADPLVEPRAGDTFFALDLQPHFIAYNHDWLLEARAAGARLVYMVHDLLPLSLADCFYPDAAGHHERWLRAVAEAHMAVCVSQATADALFGWLATSASGAPLRDIRVVHNGADIGRRLTTSGLPDDAQAVLARLREQPSLLMVGTIEPRKCHAQVLDAFETLWAGASPATLVIAGRPGWMTDALVARLRGHEERGRRLLWIEDASDEYVDALYRTCSGVILASRGEGFGLPLVEAARHGIPVVARDLPVFRELAGDHAFYFDDDAPHALAASIERWFALREQGLHPSSAGVRCISWKESTARLRRLLEAGDQVGT